MSTTNTLTSKNDSENFYNTTNSYVKFALITRAIGLHRWAVITGSQDDAAWLLAVGSRGCFKPCLEQRNSSQTEIGVFKHHIWTAESSLTNIFATFSKLKNTIKKCLLFVKFTWKISFFKCGTRTAYKMLSV